MKCYKTSPNHTLIQWREGERSTCDGKGEEKMLHAQLRDLQKREIENKAN
jgi:hypothetical protein